MRALHARDRYAALPGWHPWKRESGAPLEGYTVRSAVDVWAALTGPRHA